MSVGGAILIVVATLAASAGIAQASATWTVLSATKTEVWADTPFAINATTPSDTNQVCADFRDGVFLQTWPFSDGLPWPGTGWNQSWAVSTLNDSGTHTLVVRCYQALHRDWYHAGSTPPELTLDYPYDSGVSITYHADSDWSAQLTSTETDVWADTTFSIGSTTPVNPDQLCLVFKGDTELFSGSWDQLSSIGMFNTSGILGDFNHMTAPSSGSTDISIRCYPTTRTEAIAAGAWPGYADSYASGVTITAHATEWASLSMTATDVWANSKVGITSTTPTSSMERCAWFTDETYVAWFYWGSWETIWNGTDTLGSAGLAPATGSVKMDVRCYGMLGAAGLGSVSYDEPFRSGVSFTAHAGFKPAPTWAQLSVYVNDMWTPDGYLVDVGTGDYLVMSSTTPSDTDQQCAQFVNGMLAGVFSWSSTQDSGLWNTPLLAEEYGMIPSSGTFVFDIRCYARTMAEANGAEPAYDDPYNSGFQVTGHADNSSSATGADTFQPASSRPTVVITSVPEEPFQPAYTDSSFGQGPGAAVWSDAGSDYEVSVAVAEANGASDVATVQLCLYAGGHDSECEATQPDPRYALVLEWTRPGDATLGGSGFDGFAKVGDNNARLNGEATGSVSTWADEVCTGETCTSDAFHTNLHFWFDVSDAMTAGTGWYARAIATNSSGQSNSGTNADPDQDVVLTAGVAYFGWVTTPRTALDYGTLDASASSTRTGSLGTFIANGASSLFLAAEDFAYAGTFGEATLPLATGDTAGSVASGSVALDCAYGAEFNEADAVRVGTEPVQIASDLFVAGTGEAGDRTTANTCRLTYGGGAPISKVSYDAMVWVGIGPSDGLPFAGAMPGSESLYIPR